MAGAGGSWGDVPPAQPKQNVGYVYDQFGNILADPSGVLQDTGYATSATDAAQTIGENSIAAVEHAAKTFWNGLTYLKWGAIIALGLVALHEVNSFRGSPVRVYRANPSRRRSRRKSRRSRR